MKTKILTIRIPEEMENLIVKRAQKHKWTKSFFAFEILRKFLYELSGDL